jgi:DNA replication and repair protein RecF
LFEGGGARRRFLDRLVYGFEPEHAARIAAYEQAMSERNRLLKREGQGNGQADPAWLNALEATLAGRAVAIAAARAETLARIDTAMAEMDRAFPLARSDVRGVVEEQLRAASSALDAEDWLREQLASSRRRDAMIGRTSIGTHRSEWLVWHPKGTEAAQCSTGEQKALLLSILLAQAHASQRWLSRVPLLLLDEVVAHLDAQRRGALFEQIRALKVQAWLTGTDAALFSELLPDAQGLTVTQAEIAPMAG